MTLKLPRTKNTMLEHKIYLLVLKKNENAT